MAVDTDESEMRRKGGDDMSEYNGFRIDTEGAKVLRREKRFSDKFSDDDIERALREASIKVGKFVWPEGIK